MSKITKKIFKNVMYQGDDKEGEDNDKMVDEMMENLDSFVLEPAPQV